jgi:CRP-like cAMP-binding protein
VRDIAQEVRYMEGARIVKAGDDGDSFFVLVSGQAKVVSRGGKMLNRLLPGDFFGEISLLDGGDRTANVVAETPLVVLMVRRSRFHRMLAEDPSVTVSMLKQVARRLRQMQRDISA